MTAGSTSSGDDMTSTDQAKLSTMESTDGNWSSETEAKDPPQSSYSVETPYGFHLDLDFLKYVDDIEKGYTIKRIPIHRKAKHPKFSTLPRNFSLPENGSKAYSPSQSSSFLTQRKTSLGTEESTFPVTSIESSSSSAYLNEPSYRRKALLIETIKQDSVNLGEEPSKCSRGRPQLLRASSMPATLPPVQNSEENWLSEDSPPLELLQSMDGKDLEFDLTPSKESLELDSFSDSSLMVSENVRYLKPQNIMASCANQKPTDQETATLMEEKQEEELPKEKIQLCDLWQNQHLISEELLVVTESSEEACSVREANNCLLLVQSGLDSSGTLEPICESQSQEETELNICEHIPQVIKEDEVSSLVTSEMGAALHLEPLADEEPSKIVALKHHIAILEEQLNNKTEELEQIRIILKQQDKEIKAKERSIEILVSSKAQLEEKLCWESSREIKPSMQASSALHYHDAAVNTETVHENVAKGASDKGINVSISIPMESVGCDAHTANNVNMQLEEISEEFVYTDHERASIPISAGEQDCTSFGMEQVSDGSILIMKNNVLNTDEHIDKNKYQNEVYQCGMQLSSSRVPGGGRCSELADAKEERNETVYKEDFNQDLNDEENHPEPMDSPADPSIRQYVKKIQDLLQEQWMCLEHGYPELASAIKQPASKLSSIQNQLVNSLNLLLSAYTMQTPADEENSSTQCQQLEISPSTSLKSIMKKKGTGFHTGGNSTKKNLQFVGVNGGYESTSSEDSSCDESSSTENSNSDPEGNYGSEGDRRGEENNEGAQKASGPSLYMKREASDSEGFENTKRESTQHKAERKFKPSVDFLKGCQILSKNMSEIRTTKDKLLRHVLSTICQEWFRISSRKSSSPDIVAAYLQEAEAIHPQLQNIIVNLADGNGNTALHYSVSHSNFQIVKLLLETGVCDVDHQNKAGYTAVMITPLASAETDEEMEVVTKLLKEGNVNIRASQGGQTALILGVSHDREDMVKALLSCGADVNLQDDTGLSPLMVACQYGNTEIVKILLIHPSCNIELTDKITDIRFNVSGTSREWVA
uniref:Uncharacterized protein n=1 Tax=Sphaerodactylus townsendi TaxID=933632 RepID=A0ACB8F3T6_9SAUR